MSEWIVETVDELDALPEKTVIDWVCPGVTWTYCKRGARWLMIGRDVSTTSSALAGRPLQVVSVPIEALLSDETVRAVDPGGTWSSIRPMLRAAIAHVARGGRL